MAEAHIIPQGCGTILGRIRPLESCLKLIIKPWKGLWYKEFAIKGRSWCKAGCRAVSNRRSLNFMSKQLDPLKTTTPELHRFWFYIRTEKQWYDVIRECREWFGKNWRGMSKVRRKLESRHHVGSITFTRSQALPVWFEVPDPRFATWVSVKFSLQVESDAKHTGGK